MSDNIQLCIVVAVAENRVIGAENGLPWRLPNDLQYFKKVTMGHPVVMGRLTFESIGRPLPGRENCVITRQEDWQHEGVKAFTSIELAINHAKQSCQKENIKKIMIIGGANIYQQVLPACDRLYLTEVHAKVDGDAFFPEFNRDDWQEISRETYDADETNPYAYSFVVLDRKPAH